MKCPFCGHLDDKVIDSRGVGSGDVIRRRRECDGCNRRFTTYERIEDVLPTVVKKDGRREPFDRLKLIRGLRTACSKRPVSIERIEAVADAIEHEAQESERREITAVRARRACHASSSRVGRGGVCSALPASTARFAMLTSSYVSWGSSFRAAPLRRHRGRQPRPSAEATPPR